MMMNQEPKNMLTEKKNLSFNRESDNHWYLECPAYEELMTKQFRKTHTYVGEDKALHRYADKQDLTNPQDDHTKHPDWEKLNPHQDLKLMPDAEDVLNLYKGNRVEMEVIAGGCVSNCYEVLHRTFCTEQFAYYEGVVKGQKVSLTLNLVHLFPYEYLFPEHLHFRVLMD